jgi:16S rRNA processing protein RimM
VAESKGEGPSFISLARVIKPQGNKGEVAVELSTDFPEKFAERKHILALQKDGSQRELEIEDFWPHKGRMILKFQGVDNINDAELLAGCVLQVPQTERVKLEAGAYFVSDLVGCEVFVTSENIARSIGKITDVEFNTGDAPLLTVMEGKREHLIPFAGEFIVNVATDAKRIEMKLPDGLLEIDAPLNAFEKKQQHQM